MELHVNQYDLKRLECYSRNMADYHLVMDLVPTVSKLYCLGAMGETHFSAVQLVICLIGTWLVVAFNFCNVMVFVYRLS